MKNAIEIKDLRKHYWLFDKDYKIIKWLFTKKGYTSIKRAIEANDITALLQEHNRLLGDEMTQGQLPLKFNFDYGRNAGSGRRTAPLALTKPPTDETP